MASFGIIVLGLFLFGCRESGGAPDRASLNPAIVATTIKKVLANRIFLMNTLCSTFMLSGFIIFLSLSASVLIEGFGVRGDIYGFLFAAVSLSFLAGTFISGRLVAHLKLDQMVELGIAIGSAGGIGNFRCELSSSRYHPHGYLRLWSGACDTARHSCCINAAFQHGGNRIIGQRVSSEHDKRGHFVRTHIIHPR